MITNRFLHYKTKLSFLADLDTYGEALNDKIVFIQDNKTIWTHGEYYGVMPESLSVDTTLSDTSTNPVQNKVIKVTIDNLTEVCLLLLTSIENINSSINADVESVANKFTEILEFLESISDTELNTIIELITAEKNRAVAAEKDLLSQINVLKNNPGGISPDGIRHIILTLEAYDALTEYDNNTLYFIVNIQNESWTFGDTFPITFGTTFKFGGTFPITLT